jgi:hypothetical protein
MTIRKVLLIPLVISLVLFSVFAPEIWRTALGIIGTIAITPSTVLLLVAATAVLFGGHLLRARKAALLMRPIEISKTKTQFRAFSVGQLFNNLLPLRIGELIRAAILSQKLNLSFVYSLALIVFERVIDLLFVCLAVALLGGILGLLSPTIVTVILIGAVIALAGLLFLYVAMRQPVWFLSLVYRSSRIFNDGLRDQIRFKIWSLGYGLTKSLSATNTRVYLGYTAGMWAMYIGAMILVATATLPILSTAQYLLAGLAPYVGVSLPSGPASLGSFSGIVGLFAQNFGAQTATVMVYSIVAWAVMTLPISLVGIILLLTKTVEPVWTRRRRAASDASLENKLRRSEDISEELGVFLENYFSGNDLSRIVNRLERGKDFKLVKYFKGGSDAITVLVLQNGKRVVKKIIPIKFKDRLKAQYDWLKAYGGRHSIVSVLNERSRKDYYSIDLAYDEHSVPFFEYVHEIPLRDATALLDRTWKALERGVYGKVGKTKRDKAALETYIDRHIYQCLDKAAAVDPELSKATLPKKITINGKRYDNLYQILAKIKKHPKAWADLSQYRPGRAVHGDLIMDNLLYSTKTKKVIIIDPAPDGNIFNGPVFDFGKAVQSLHCGYEFLLRDESAVTLENGDSISFREAISTRYGELDEYVRTTLAKRYLAPAERRSILFHGGTLYLRRLKHQVYYTPENVLKFYAVGVRTLNEFLDQYRRAR